MYIFILT